MTDERIFVIPKRRAVLAIVTALIVLFIGMLASFQYANYVNRQSNQKWCGIIVLFDDTYKEAPPPSDAGKKFAVEFSKLRNAPDYNCR